MKIYRAEIHGHLIEARKGDLGGEMVLLDGRVVSEKPLAGLGKESHFFDIQDDNDQTRHIEIRFCDNSTWWLWRYCVAISVDGREQCRVESTDPDRDDDHCRNCGYSLRGLTVEYEEIRCPECGRHTPAVMISRPDPENTEQ